MSTSTISVVLIGAFPEDVAFIKGGVQASVYGLARALLERGDAIATVIALPVKHCSGISREGGTREVGGITILYLKAHRFLFCDLAHLPRILREIRVSGAEVVHVHGAGWVQAALMVWLRVARIKTVWTLHGVAAKETLYQYSLHKTPAHFARHVLYAWLDRLLVALSPHVLVNTPYVVRELGIRKHVSVIPQGIFVREFEEASRVARSEPLILSVGLLTVRKGYEKTIEAFAKVRQRCPESRLVIACSVTDKIYYGQIRELIAKLDLEDSVELQVDLPRAEILRLFARARVFALHSKEESQGVALCEALAASLPVVATEVGGIPYVVDNEKNGLLVRFGDTSAFASAIIMLLEDNALWQQMSKLAKISARKFDWKNITNEVMNVYQGL